jgi:hypothetical protein
MKHTSLLFLVFAPLMLVAQYDGAPQDSAALALRAAAPDYSNLAYWIAHPKVADLADVVPGRKKFKDEQTLAEADVFFVYPTIYTGAQHPDHPWFSDVNDQAFNQKIAESTIKYQASVFNGAGRIYAPLYRQAHIGVFYADTVFMQTALDMAYEDVKAAFVYYLAHWHNDRPLIIASHSQGTVHAARLIKEFVEGTPLQEKLVAAYIIGMPVKRTYFSNIPICDSPDDVGCWMTWNTFLSGYTPPRQAAFDKAASVNPLSWTTDTLVADRKMNNGGILKNFKRIHPGLCDAQNHEGKLWIHKPRFFGNFLLRWKRFHVVDYNLFYVNIRENAQLRVSTYLREQRER